MNRINEIIYYYGYPVCRLCINNLYNVHLVPKDCVYSEEEEMDCPCCNQTRNIVIGLRASGKLKLMFKNIEVE